MPGPYSEIVVSGDTGSVTLMVDPDTFSLNARGAARIVEATDGTKYLNYLKTNPDDVGYQGDLSISGLYLTKGDCDTLLDMARKKSLVTIEGLDDFIAGTYLLVSFSCNPIKPAVLFPGETDPVIRFSYSITLQKADDE